jgi:hypothetical protein
MASSLHVDLLSNAGTGNGADKLWEGGKAAFLAEATFGGGSVKLQIKLPQGTYADVTLATLSAAGMVVTDLPPGTYRAVATTATAVYSRLVRISLC